MADLIQDALKDIDWSPSDTLTDAAKKFAFTMKRLFPESQNKPTGESEFGDASKGEDYGYPGLENLYRMQRDKEGGIRPGGAGSQNFRGLTELAGMQKSLERGTSIGAGNAFSQSSRYGVDENGVPKTGRWQGMAGVGGPGFTTGLGEKRRLRTSSDDKDSKKNLSIQEQQAASLQSIESNIKSAVTVN